VVLRAGMDTDAKGNIIYSCRGSSPGCPICSQTILTDIPQLYISGGLATWCNITIDVRERICKDGKRTERALERVRNSRSAVRELVTA
jgi:hypothetical protein